MKASNKPDTASVSNDEKIQMMTYIEIRDECLLYNQIKIILEKKVAISSRLAHFTIRGMVEQLIFMDFFTNDNI